MNLLGLSQKNGPTASSRVYFGSMRPATIYSAAAWRPATGLG